MSDILASRKGYVHPCDPEDSWIINAPTKWIDIKQTVDKGESWNTAAAKKLAALREEKAEEMILSGKKFYRHRMDQIRSWLFEDNDSPEDIAALIGSSIKTVLIYKKIFQETKGYSWMHDDTDISGAVRWLPVGHAKLDHYFVGE